MSSNGWDFPTFFKVVRGIFLMALFGGGSAWLSVSILQTVMMVRETNAIVKELKERPCLCGHKK